MSENQGLSRENPIAMTRKYMNRKGKSARRPGAPARSVRAKKPDAVEMLVSAGAQTLALPVDPAWAAGIRFNLQLLFRHAALIDEFSLPNDSEPAPVFRA
jgi:hypothetical protein